MKKGWQTKKVSEIAKHSLGKMLDKAKNKGEPKPYLRNLNVRWFDFDLSDVLEMPFLPTEAEKYTAVKGDVLICEGGYPGRAAIWEQDEPIYFQKALHRVRFHEPERNTWFVYYLLSKDLDGTLKNHFNGAGIQHFTGEALAQFPVPIPPLAEQQRIVGLLDEAFEGLATAKANAEKNLQNARALFESHLQSVFTQRDGGWPTKQLGDVCDFEGGSQPPKSEFLYSPKAGYVRFLQIRDFGSEKHVTFIPESKKNRLCREDDIMIGRYGASVGKILTGKAGAYNVALMKTIPDIARLDRSFFYHYLISGAFQERLTNVAARSAQNGFSKEDIYGFPVPVPPLEEQQKVIEQLGPLSEETERLARLYERKQAALEALKKSLLHRAFAGEL